MPGELPLATSVADAHRLTALDVCGWERTLALGRLHGISGRWHGLLEVAGRLGDIPHRVRTHLESDHLLALRRTQVARWEVNRLMHALRDTDVPLVLLKGAAYIMGDLPPGRARLISDVDILVPEHQLAATESVLKAHGWDMHATSAYDERYYRAWMHELPPFQHQTRGSMVDVHHNLTPRTSRLFPNAEKILTNRQLIAHDGGRPIFALAPEDMVIHSALHGFYGGEFTNCFRDILDVHELATYFAERDTAFWPRLVARTNELNVGRAVFYALRYAHRHMHTVLPPAVLLASRAWAPVAVPLLAMDRVIAAVYLPALPPTLLQRAALRALYMRSHWIKMPPVMLARHLWTKHRQRRAEKATAASV